MQPTQAQKKSGSRTVSADIEAEHPRGVEVAEGPAQRREPTVPQVVTGRLHRVQRRTGLEEVRQLEPGCRDRGESVKGLGWGGG